MPSATVTCFGHRFTAELVGERVVVRRDGTARALGGWEPMFGTISGCEEIVDGPGRAEHVLLCLEDALLAAVGFGPPLLPGGRALAAPDAGARVGA